MKTLLKFEADWCGPCQQIKPLVNDVITDHKEVQLKTINVDEKDNESLVLRHGVRAIPTLVLLDEQESIVATHRGTLNRAQLENLIAS
jgi:thioredoxin 1